jgi:hypothetical protein
MRSLPTVGLGIAAICVLASATVSGLDAEGTRIIQSATVWSNLATALNLSPATEQSFEGTT